MGAICLLEHSEKLQNLVDDAIDKGAEILARGSFGHLGEDAVDQYFPPTVIVNVNHSMKLMQEEVTKIVVCQVQDSVIHNNHNHLEYNLTDPVSSEDYLNI